MTRSEVKFDHVSFYHFEDANPVINDLNLVIRPGEKVGLISCSGIEKSTLVNLLLRFHDGGHILIDGQDIAHVTQDSLHHGKILHCCTALCTTTFSTAAPRHPTQK